MFLVQLGARVRSWTAKTEFAGWPPEPASVDGPDKHQAKRPCRAASRRAWGLAVEQDRRRGSDTASCSRSRPGPPPAARTEKAHVPLTRREKQIAELIAQGMSNRQIAANLVIAQRTVGSHVEHIPQKLGLTHSAGRGLTADRDVTTLTS